MCCEIFGEIWFGIWNLRREKPGEIWGKDFSRQVVQVGVGALLGVFHIIIIKLRVVGWALVPCTCHHPARLSTPGRAAPRASTALGVEWGGIEGAGKIGAS